MVRCLLETSRRALRQYGGSMQPRDQARLCFSPGTTTCLVLGKPRDLSKFDRSCLREQSNTTLQIWCESQRVFTEHLAQALPPGRRRAHSEFEIRLWYYLATRLVVSLFNMRLCSYFTELV